MASEEADNAPTQTPLPDLSNTNHFNDTMHCYGYDSGPDWQQFDPQQPAYAPAGWEFSPDNSQIMSPTLQSLAVSALDQSLLNSSHDPFHNHRASQESSVDNPTANDTTSVNVADCHNGVVNGSDNNAALYGIHLHGVQDPSSAHAPDMHEYPDPSVAGDNLNDPYGQYRPQSMNGGMVVETGPADLLPIDHQNQDGTMFVEMGQANPLPIDYQNQNGTTFVTMAQANPLRNDHHDQKGTMLVETAQENPDQHDQDDNSGLMITSENAYFRARSQNSQSVADQTMLRYLANPNVQCQYVKQLFDAIKNVTDIEDNERIAKPFRDGTWTDQEIEMGSWEVLLATRDSQCGRLLRGHDSKYESYDTFDHRFRTIVDACRVSKLFCKSILAPSFLSRAVDRPYYEFMRKENNKQLNHAKTQQNLAGKAAMKRGLVEVNEQNGNWVVKRETPPMQSIEDEEDIYEADESTPNTDLQSSTGRLTKSSGQKRALQQNVNEDEGFAVETPVKRRLSCRSKSRTATATATSTADAGNDGDLIRPARLRSGSRLSLRRGTLPPRRQPLMTDPVPGYEIQDAASITSSSFSMQDAANAPSSSLSMKVDAIEEESPVDPGLKAGRLIPSFSRPRRHVPSYKNTESATDELRQRYKDLIAEMLNIPKDATFRVSLSKLRFYARCYNKLYEDSQWTHANFKQAGPAQNRFGMTYRVYDKSGNCVGHFAKVLPDLDGIAIARGDISIDGRINDNANKMFTVGGGAEKLKALGFNSNAFGFFHADIIKYDEVDH